MTNAPVLPSSPQIVEELPPLAEPPTETQNITQSDTVVAESKPDILYLLPTVPAVLPSDLPVRSEKEADETETEVLHLPLEEVGMDENDTTTFSAATVLSGDGEVYHASPGYPHLLDVDSETDYHYDMAELPVSPHEWKFLPASSLPTGCTSEMPTYETPEILPHFILSVQMLWYLLLYLGFNIRAF